MKKIRPVLVTIGAFLTMCFLFMTLFAACTAQLWRESEMLTEALSLRQELIQPLLERVGARIDPTPYIACIPRLPWLFLCMTALFSGLTMLAGRTGDRNKLCLLGGAFGGAAILIVLTAVMIISAGIPALLGELNTGAAAVFGRLQRRMILQCAASAVLLSSVFVLCVRNRKGKTA